MAMHVVINHEVKQVKNGYFATASGLGLAAQGYNNEEVARRNLERTVRLFLTPFARDGRLKEELTRMGLTVENIGEDTTHELAISLR